MRILFTDSSYVGRFRGIVPTPIELSAKWLQNFTAGLRTCETVTLESAYLVSSSPVVLTPPTESYRATRRML
ncbi:hypothetical protein F5Y01DRAFT_294959 [Xylaria sp. FL0043]|nr:hypothetical protein F5Y01DRAFT_294959 [Xylaria sp. FL0043]